MYNRELPLRFDAVTDFSPMPEVPTTPTPQLELAGEAQEPPPEQAFKKTEKKKAKKPMRKPAKKGKR